MNKTVAIVDSSDKIDTLLTLLFDNEPLIYIIICYIYYFGFSQDDVCCYIYQNSTYPTTDKQGNKLALESYPDLYSLCQTFNFNLCILRRGILYRKLQQYAENTGLTNVCAMSLRKTWAYNVLCKGVDYSYVKYQLSYRGSIIQFFEYLGISNDDILANENLKKLYFKGIFTCLSSTNPKFSEFQLKVLRDFVQ